MRALNSDTLAPEAIAHIETDEEDEHAYTVTRPKKEPFFAKCAIWQHKTDNYIVWMYRGKHYVKHIVSDDDLEEVGEIVTAFKPVQKSSVVTTTTTTPTTTTTKRSSTVVSSRDDDASSQTPKKKKKMQADAPSAAVQPPAVQPAAPAAPAAPVAPVAPAVPSTAAAPTTTGKDSFEPDCAGADEAAVADDATSNLETTAAGESLASKIADLEAELASTSTQLSATEAATEHERNKHNTYKQTKQREMKKKDAELSEMTKQMSSSQVLLANQTIIDKRGVSLKHPSACVETLIKAAFTALQTKKAAGISKPTTTTFQFCDNGAWTAITDDAAHAQLLKLLQPSGAPHKVKYSIGNNNYEAVLVSGYQDHDILQTNPLYGTRRKIRDASTHAGSPTDVDFEILFGKESIIELPADFVHQLLSEHDFQVDQAYEMSSSIAELAEAYSALGSNFKYVPSGGKQRAVCSEKWTKPPGLWQWLTIAKSRGYTRCRLVMHGGSQTNYDRVRADPVGFDLQYSGQQGEAHNNGFGFDFGLSDHVTVGYNSSGKKAGSCILALLLTHEKVGWSHHGRDNQHGGVTLKEDSLWAESYKTFGLSLGNRVPVTGIDNGVVVHETNLALPLGFAEAI